MKYFILIILLCLTSCKDLLQKDKFVELELSEKLEYSPSGRASSYYFPNDRPSNKLLLSCSEIQYLDMQITPLNSKSPTYVRIKFKNSNSSLQIVYSERVSMDKESPRHKLIKSLYNKIKLECNLN